MCVSSLPKTVTRQRRDCDLNPGPSAPESSTLTTRLPSHPHITLVQFYTAVARYNVWNSAGVENDTPVYTGVQFFSLTLLTNFLLAPSKLRLAPDIRLN